MASVSLKFDSADGDFPFPLELPRSKSIAARALILNYLTGNHTRIIGIPDCDDSRELRAAISELSVLVPSLPERLKSGDDNYLYGSFNLGLGGTSLRFFTALAASVPGLESEIDCAAPLRRRPFAQLGRCLKEAGASIHYTALDGYPPMSVKGSRIGGGRIEVGGDISSQFASAIMLASPAWEKGLELCLTGEHPVSLPYLEMTASVMRSFNIDVRIEGREIFVKNGLPDAPEFYEVESDWSAASYFYELALLCPGKKLQISSLTSARDSLQGDSRCEKIFGFLGVDTIYNEDGSALLQADASKINALRKAGSVIELDMNSTPDIVPAIAVGMCLSGLKFKFTGIGHLRHKESDRILSVQTELEKIGFALESGPDWMTWKGSRTPVGENELIETYNDHRIAMAFAVAATRLPYLSISDPGVVDKSFADFWNQMKRAGMQVNFYGGN